MKKTLADLKRDITVGTKIIQTKREEARPLPDQYGDVSKFKYGPLMVVPIPERLQGTRTVTYKDTTGFYMSATPEDGKRGSFLAFPKASELEYHDNSTFSVTAHRATGEPWLRMHYKIID